MRLRPVVAVASCALAFAAPASAAFPDYPGEPRMHADTAPVGFSVPLLGPLHSPYGYRWGRLHAGLDIAVLGTDRVAAVAPGIVTAVGYLDQHAGYGNVVKLRHPNGLVTMYAHLASMSVRVGQRVEAGSRLGRAGCTGSCTGPHLHFEVHRRGRPIDPLPFLRGKLSS